VTEDIVRTREQAADGTPARTWSAYVGGWAPEADAPRFAVHEPATGQALAMVEASSDAAVARAVADSRRAYDAGWRHTTPRDRAGLLREAAAVIRAHAGELADSEAREVGKPRRAALRCAALRFDISYCSAAFDYYAGLAETLHGEIVDSGPIEARVKYEPYGVVAAILPFNWPPIHFSKKSAPALAAGNTVVIKPGEQAPLTVLRLVELVNQVLPPGVVNAVVGPAAGPALTSNPLVERITFTGATATGRAVLRAAAANLTYATMELGGKNALIVLDDADMDVAIDTAIEGMFYNQGGGVHVNRTAAGARVPL
jgi:acyl-CoA reductase-like NAD-dependent aldehyde dehydrogenase